MRSSAEELADRQFLDYCRAEGDATVTLEAVRQALASIPGTMTEACAEERAEHGWMSGQNPAIRC